MTADLGERRSGSGYSVTYAENTFRLTSALAELELDVTTQLSLDTSSEHHTFEIVALVRKNLAENASYEIWNKGSDSRRVGWLIPANALSSNQHDYADNQHFLKYAFVAMREVLQNHTQLFNDHLAEISARRATSVSFSELFHDNVAFLIICNELVENSFNPDLMVPSLISRGYLPLAVCKPDEIEWEGKPLEATTTNLHIRGTGDGIVRSDLPARMMSIAASSRGSVVTQFFYLYQVVELLMDEVLYALLPGIGKKVTRTIEDDQYFLLRDHLESLQSQLGEKARLRLMMKSFESGDAAIEDLVSASAEFLESVGADSKEGVFQLYQVRNFIVHQARNIPPASEVYLKNVVVEFAAFLPMVLHTFRRPAEI